ncbi:hypothetical protein CALVIDRAFT_603354 [Calocera viscosa TUFC12733]|uniref:Myb-like domain-containing protein n=1 Tax=Calocera viscosa (strain TUFC12733) TaxID=1330018 RepID=A0A167FV45_CALVF|nr:hypothetical protein CALVIDRAFT_603354 [Calocera viscosa TUFC12733]
MATLGLTDIALSANKSYQQDILDFASECQAKLKAVESLLSDVEKLQAQRQNAEGIDDVSDEELEEDGTDIIYAKGAIRAVGPCAWVNLKAEDSPFSSAFTLADNYRVLTTPRPWMSRERAALRISVQTELRRAYLLDVQSQGGSALRALKTFDAEAALQNVKCDEVQWDNVAKILRNNSVAKSPRSGSMCRIQWLAMDNPSINHADWSAEEKQSLVAEVKRRLEDTQNGLDWDDIVRVHNEKFQARTVIQCLRAYRATVVSRELWSEEEDELLQEAVMRFGFNWVQVAKHIGHGRTSRGARIRWQQRKKARLSFGTDISTEPQRPER